MPDLARTLDNLVSSLVLSFLGPEVSTHCMLIWIKRSRNCLVGVDVARND